VKTTEGQEIVDRVWESGRLWKEHLADSKKHAVEFHVFGRNGEMTRDDVPQRVTGCCWISTLVANYPKAMGDNVFRLAYIFEVRP